MRSTCSLPDGAVAAARFLRRRCGSEPDPLVADLHTRLVDGALDEPDAPVRRAATISLDGTPIVYSCSVGAEPLPLRLLVEPGGLARNTAEQVDFARGLLDELLERAGWPAAAEPVDVVAGAVLPRDREALRALDGGIWLGLAAGAHLELRVYLSLRGGDALGRWQRVADALGPFGDTRARDTFVSLLERVAPHAVPVGLGAVLAGGRLRGMRLYVSLPHPDRRTLRLMAGPGCDAAVDRLDDELGPFPAHSVTAGFDFAVRDGAIVPGLGRTKLDAACPIGSPEPIAASLERLAGGCGFSARALRVFLEDLRACFSGSLLQYASVGLRSGPLHVTGYAQPTGLARG